MGAAAGGEGEEAAVVGGRAQVHDGGGAARRGGGGERLQAPQDEMGRERWRAAKRTRPPERRSPRRPSPSGCRTRAWWGAPCRRGTAAGTGRRLGRRGGGRRTRSMAKSPSASSGARDTATSARGGSYGVENLSGGKDLYMQGG